MSPCLIGPGVTVMDSSWSGHEMFEQIRDEINEYGELNPGSVLILDEYADFYLFQQLQINKNLKY
jgi:hypothetical protein